MIDSDFRVQVWIAANRSKWAKILKHWKLYRNKARQFRDSTNDITEDFYEHFNIGKALLDTPLHQSFWNHFLRKHWK